MFYPPEPWRQCRHPEIGHLVDEAKTRLEHATRGLVEKLIEAEPGARRSMIYAIVIPQIPQETRELCKLVLALQSKTLPRSWDVELLGVRGIAFLCPKVNQSLTNYLEDMEGKLGSRHGMQSLQLNALARELVLCNDKLLDGQGSHRLLLAQDHGIFRREAEQVWQNSPGKLETFNRMCRISKRLMAILSDPKGRPSFSLALRQDIPGPTVTQLLRSGLKSKLRMKNRDFETTFIEWRRKALAELQRKGQNIRYLAY